MWINRDISNKIKILSENFPAVILTGARQTGKTCLLTRLFPNHNYVTLDTVQDAALAEDSPETFLGRYPPPLLIDEVQYAPKLFRHIKVAIDRDRHNMGQFILTGSQKFVLMKEVSESLAGRCGILELENLSIKELIPAIADINPETCLIRGLAPELWRNQDMPAWAFYQAYVATYIERDVRQIINVRNIRDFDRFIRLLATRNAQLVDRNSLSRELGLANNTIQSWLSVLIATNQVMLLEPWYINMGKRIIKSPKLYFADPGLVGYLLGVSEVISSPFFGAMWESLVYSEIRKINDLLETPYSIWFYRDNQAQEIDLILHHGHSAIFIEIKTKEIPADNDARIINKIAKYAHDKKITLWQDITKYIICRTPTPFTLSNNVTVIGLKDISKILSE